MGDALSRFRLYFWRTVMNMENVARISPVMAKGTATVREATQLMLEHSVSTIVITDALHRPLGIFTQHDLMQKVVCADLNPQTTTLDRVMSAPVHTMPVDASFKEGLKLMNQHQCRHVALVNEDGSLAAVLSMSDLLACRVMDKETTLQVLQGYANAGGPG